MLAAKTVNGEDYCPVGKPSAEMGFVVLGGG